MGYTLQNIAGYKQEKMELSRLCEILNNRAKYEKLGAKIPKGVIFYGPTGSGKTLFAKVLADMCHLHIQKVDVGTSIDAEDVSRQLVKAFQKAQNRNAPTMVFFDEIDKLLPNQEEEYYTDQSKILLTQLLTLIDGMNSEGKVIFVATCNDYGVLPLPLVRPGRIDRKIEIGLPSVASCRAILEYYLGKTSCRFEMSAEDMAEMANGLCGATLETWVNECILHSEENGFVSAAAIKNKLFEIKQEDIPRKNLPLTDRIIACRNLGFFVIARSQNKGNYVLNMENATVCNDFFDTVIGNTEEHDEWDDDDDEWDDKTQATEYYCKQDLLNAISVLYGGYIAQQKVFCKTYADFSGYEFRQIDSILKRLAGEGMLGMEMRYSHYRHEYLAPYTTEKLERLNAVWERVSADCYAKAEKIVAEHLSLIEKLMPILIEHRSLSKKKCEPIIAQLLEQTK